MQAVLAEAQKMILNKSLNELDDHYKGLLCKRLSFAPIPNWCFSRLNRLELTEASTSELWLFGAFN